MAAIDQIGQVQSALTALSSSSGGVNKINPATLANQVAGAAGAGDISKIAGAQAQISGALGSGINLGAISKATDCFKNIDDILLDKIKAKAVETLLSNSNVSALVGQVSAIKATVDTAKGILDSVKSLKEKSLMDLVIAAKNAGFLDRIGIANQVAGKFGSAIGAAGAAVSGVVGAAGAAVGAVAGAAGAAAGAVTGAISNVNDFVSQITNIDVCSMVNQKLGVNGPVPTPAKILQEAPAPYPTFVPPVNVNMSAFDAKRKYDDSLFRLQDIAGDKTGVENSGANLAMLNELQYLCRAMVNKAGETGGGDAFNSQMGAEIERKLSMYKGSWPLTTLTQFKVRANNLLNTASKEAPAIKEFTLLQNSGTATSGQLASMGVTVYGGPDVDFTTFLDIKPAQRPPQLAQYWEGRGYSIAKNEERGRAKGIKYGTLNLSDAYKGAYGYQLQSGVSAASTRFPGDTVLQLKNPDGSIFDPAGLNPSGMVTVHDTGNAKLTFNKLDLFVNDQNAYSLYKRAPLNSVQVFVVSLGTKEAPQYKRAQKMFGGR